MGPRSNMPVVLMRHQNGIGKQGQVGAVQLQAGECRLQPGAGRWGRAAFSLESQGERGPAGTLNVRFQPTVRE